MDAAAGWLKPQSVIESEVDFLTNSYANSGRGICARAGHVDELIDDARYAVADFINADKASVVFTSGATDALNRVVNIIKNTISIKNPIVAVSDLDHHSARLPFEILAQNGGCKTIIMPLDNELNIDVNNIPNADVCVITAMSNVIGVAQDVESIIRAARSKNPDVITIVDASQYVAHCKIDVKKWDCDFVAFSGHKIGSDTGVGILYIKNPDKYFPDKFGGGMVNRIIDNENIILNKSPEKWEAGTLPLTQIIGLKTAIDELKNWDASRDIHEFIYDELSKIKNIKIFTPRNSCLVSFVVENMHALDFGALIGAHDICLRVGNMCASWIHKKMGIDGSVRISIGPWNTMADAQYTVDVIKKLVD